MKGQIYFCSKDVLDAHPDKTTYEWLTSGRHTYNVLKREEEQKRKAKLEKLKAKTRTRKR